MAKKKKEFEDIYKEVDSIPLSELTTEMPVFIGNEESEERCGGYYLGQSSNYVEFEIHYPKPKGPTRRLRKLKETLAVEGLTALIDAEKNLYCAVSIYE